VNQKIEFSAGYIPCATIQADIAVPRCEERENVTRADTMLKGGRSKYMN